MGPTQSPTPTQGDIAVIGLACRFPGGASNESKFWELLQGRKSAYTEVPSYRYNINAFHHASADKLNTLRPRGGHFLEENVTAFDAPFFNITSQEAKAMDPTARMLLEVAYEALENAGLPVESLAGSDTSCYVGCFTRDFHEMLMRDAETAPMYAGTGTGFSLLSNRISWFYDFHGPSLTLDTACSSSLVGLHLACQGIRSGESKVAVVSGANLILGPDLALWLSNLHMLSPSGLSKSFSEDADGYGRGEGIATVILKSYADAIRDGDTIRAVIRGSGVNQDGHTSGITLPSSDAQANLIKSTYLSAGLDYSQTPYFEAHGTGTSAGDPLELAAVAKTVSKGRKAGNELLVGSVKSNIGHLEGAAGLAGVIKCILMLENDAILPNIHFDKPSPRIPFNNWKIQIPTELLPWPSDALRRASVNSFGYGGTNAHVIIDGPRGAIPGYPYPKQESSAVFSVEEPSAKKQRLFVFSAHDEAALKRIQVQYEAYLSRLISNSSLIDHKKENSFLDALSFTLARRRSLLGWKTCILASSIEELREGMSSSALNSMRTSAKPRIAFVFTGQGAQWARMGLDLMFYPIFKESILAADTFLKTLGSEWSVLGELERGDKLSNIQLAKFSQPLCSIIQVAIVELLKSWSVGASGVVGHSSGEIAAAYCLGAISRESAWEISYWRGKICSELSTDAPKLKGAMLAVGLSSAAVQEYISNISNGKVVVACVNSPSSVTISGDETGIDELHESLKSDSVFCRKLKVQNAYHSHHMELIADKYLQKLSNITTQVPISKDIKMVSSVTQKLVSYSDLGGSYWVRNMVSPVMFSTAVQTLMQDTTQRRRRIRKGEADFDFLIEIGPHAALKGPLRQILQEQDIQNVTYHSILMRGEDAIKASLHAVGALFLHGGQISITDINLTPSKQKPLVNLPSYPWNHNLTYWSESRVSKSYRFREHGRHDLLGAPAVDFNELEPKWRHFLRPTEIPWVKDHVIHSSIIYPGAGTIAFVLEAVHQISDKSKIIKNVTFKNVSISKAIVIPDDRVGVECFLQMRRQKNVTNGSWTGWWEFTISSCLEDQKLEENSVGMVAIQYKSGVSDSWINGSSLVFESLKAKYQKARKLCTISIPPKDFYDATTAAGLTYGPSFQGLTKIAAGKDHCCCTIRIPDTKSQMPSKAESPHLIHPTTLDVIFHSVFAALGDGKLDLENAAVPVFFESLVISGTLPSGAGSEYTGFCNTKKTKDGLVADIYMSDTHWEEAKVTVKGIRCIELPSGAITSILNTPFGTLSWKPDIDLLELAALWKYTSTKSLQTKPNDLDTTSLKFVATATEAPPNIVESIVQIVDIVAHKNPNLSVVQLGFASNLLISSVLSVLGASTMETPRFSNYILDNKDISKTQEILRLLPGLSSQIKFKSLDLAIELEKQDFRSKSIDLIIAVLECGCDIENFFQNIRGALMEGGIVLMYRALAGLELSTQEPSNDVFEIFSVAIPASDLHENGILSIARLRPTKVEERPKEIWIVQHPNQEDQENEISSKVASALIDHGISVRIVEWPCNVNDLKGKHIISLFELECPLLSELSSEDFDSLKILSTQCSQLLWVTKGDDPVVCAALGYLRSLKNENPNLGLRYLHLENIESPVENIARVIVKTAIGSSIDAEFNESSGNLCINRWAADSTMTKVTAKTTTLSTQEFMALGESLAPLKLVYSHFGQQNSAHFTVDELASSEIGDDEVDIEVKATVLSTSSSKDHDQSAKGYSGIVRKTGKDSQLSTGDRVYFPASGPYRSIIITNQSLCQTIPTDSTFEEAAFWSLTYATAYQALVRMARLRSGQTVLIQDAATTLGQAAFKVAAENGANIFATVKTKEQYLLVEGLGVESLHILSESDIDLTSTIGILSKGKGIDIIINTSISGEGLRELWNCTASFGSFINVGSSNASTDPDLGMIPFKRGATFSVLNFDFMLRESPALVAELLKDFVASLKTAPFKPISPNVFSTSNISDALAFEKSEQLGNVVVTFDRKNQIPVSIQARNQLSLDGNSTFVLVGGLGGLGRSLATLLVKNGARHLVFISRSGNTSPAGQKLVQYLEAKSVNIRVFACDVSDEPSMKRVISECILDLPPIKGVIQSAAVLRDAIFEYMTYAQWREATRPKIQGSWNLHSLLPKNMDFFVMLSSISGVVGNRSQANYAAGNTYQDSLAHYRRKQGLVGTSVDLGLMIGIGLIAERGGNTNLQKSEAVGINEADFHSLMKAVISGTFCGREVPAQVICGLPSGGILQQAGLDAPFYYSDPRFLLLKKKDLQLSTEDGNQSNEENSIASQLARAISLDEAAKIITIALREKIARGLQSTLENIDAGKPLHTYGIDSLMAVEIRAWVMVNIKAEISLFDVLSGASIFGLARRVARVSGLVKKGLE